MVKKKFSFVLLVFYIGFLIKVMVLKDVPLIRIGDLMLNFGGTQYGTFNFIPFKTIGSYFDGNKGLLIASINILGNILLLVPLGYLFGVTLSKLDWLKVIALSILSGFTIELMQVVLKVGIFDIDDIILNAVGVELGFILFKIVKYVLINISKKYLYTGISLIVLLMISFTGIYYAQQGRLPISIGNTDKNGQKIFPGYNNQPNLGTDPCNGSGGIGEIVSLGNNYFILRRSDGVEQRIILSKNTSIKSSIGEIKQADLKLGDRVTIVTGPDSDLGVTADLVLICGIRLKAN